MKIFLLPYKLKPAFGIGLILCVGLLIGGWTIYRLLQGESEESQDAFNQSAETSAERQSTSKDQLKSDYEIVTLVPPDTILAIDSPQFVTGTEADAQYHDDELVIGLVINDDARAYSIPFLSRHEIVNDIVGGEPIAVTW